MDRKINLNENIGLKLKEFRSSHKVKSKDLAAYIGKSPAYITKLEQASIKQISKSELVKITNYIDNSHDGYFKFCESIASTSDTKSLEENLLIMNFDETERKIPVSKELINKINQLMSKLNITCEDLTSYINSNEEIDNEFAIEHNINISKLEYNTWNTYNEPDGTHYYIYIHFTQQRINDFLNNKIDKCEYILPYTILYHLLKKEFLSSHINAIIDIDVKKDLAKKAEDILIEYKFCSLALKAKIKDESKSNEEYNKILNQFDIDNKEYVLKLIRMISFMSQYDISYTNNKLQNIINNINNCGPSFTLAFMSLSIANLKNLQTDLRRDFLKSINNLISEYETKANSNENIDKY